MKYIDPTGKFVVFAGVNADAKAGVGGGGSAGVFVNVTSTKFELGWYASGSGGAAIGLSGGAGGEVGFLNTSDSSALGGTAYTVGVGGKALAGGSIQGIRTSDSKGDKVYGGSISGGLGVSAYVSGGVSIGATGKLISIGSDSPRSVRTHRQSH